METRRERIFPMLLAGLFFTLGYYFLQRIPSIPSFLLDYVLATLIAVFCALIVTFFWKISIHLIGLGGLAGGILAYGFKFGLDLHVLFSLVILIAGLVGVARIYLKAHSPMQVYMGFLAGFSIVFYQILS
jgi:membrane-associated phospholipid phosphatase